MIEGLEPDLVLRPKNIRILCRIRIRNTVDNIFVSMAKQVSRYPKNPDPDHL